MELNPNEKEWKGGSVPSAEPNACASLSFAGGKGNSFLSLSGGCSHMYYIFSGIWMAEECASEKRFICELPGILFNPLHCL